MTVTQKQWGHLTNPPTTLQNLQGSQAPKQVSMGVWNIILFQWIVFFEIQGTARPLLVPP